MKNVILTGGSSGIGKATVELFAQRGYRVFEFSRHGQNRQLEGGAEILHIDCDVTNPDDCRRATATVVEQVGTIDILISNAGMGISGALEFTDINEARRQFDVNFFGSVNIAQAVIPYMREKQQGRIIFVSSMAAVFSIPYQSFYSASKFAINGVALALQNEVRPFGIKVRCLLPGDVKTGFTQARAKSIAGSEVYTHMNKAVGHMEHDEMAGITPERMARKILHMATARRVAFYNTVGLQYHAFNFINKVLPATLVNWVVGKLY